MNVCIKNDLIFDIKENNTKLKCNTIIEMATNKRNKRKRRNKNKGKNKGKKNKQQQRKKEKKKRQKRRKQLRTVIGKVGRRFLKKFKQTRRNRELIKYNSRIEKLYNELISGKIKSFTADFTTFKNEFIKFISRVGYSENLIMEANGRFITLNGNNYGDLMEQLNNIEEATTFVGIADSFNDIANEINIIGEVKIYTIIEGKKASKKAKQTGTLKESKGEYAFLSDDDDDLSIDDNLFFNVKSKKKRQTPAFFKWTTKNFNKDLSVLGIFTQEQLMKADFKENCLIRAFRECGMNEINLNHIKTCCYSRNVPQSQLKKISELLKIQIRINAVDRKKQKLIYGRQFKEVYEIGIHEQHYYCNKKLPFTKYFLDNYQEVKDMEDAHLFTRKRGKYYKKDKNREIRATYVVDWLLKNREQYLENISNYGDIYKSTFYDKVLDEFKNLEYNEDLCVKYIDRHKKKKEEEPKTKIFFDFETCFKTYKREKVVKGKKIKVNVVEHIPYLVCARYLRGDKWVNKCWYGEDCGSKFLGSLRSNSLLIAHNCGYDFRFIVKNLFSLSLIEKGTSLMCATCKIRNNVGQMLDLTIKDSYKLITMPLRDFGKCFQLDQQKDLMLYDIYTLTNVKKRFISYEKCLKSQHINEDNIALFKNNCVKWGCLKNDFVDIVLYSKKYCVIDCEVLQKGYEKFRGWLIAPPFNIDIDKKITISSLAHQYMVNEGVYDEVASLAGVPRAFLQKSLVGGRCMTRDNKKWWLKGRINDMDAVSLYPSSMVRMGGYLKGIPKVLQNNQLHYGFISRCDGYFIKINITKVGKKLHFPLLSKITDKGVREFSNNVGVFYVDRFTLEDLITYHEIEFNIIKGYYYDEGRNNTIKEVMTRCFNERLKKKKEKNPIQVVYKLIMNSCYGKTIMKPHKIDCVIVDTTEAMRKYITLNFNMINEFTKIAGCDKWKIKTYKAIDEHFTLNCVGIEILSMSKRIMNEVIGTAEDNDLKIYYQDTDSIHINDTDIKPLIEIYEKKFNRRFIGKNLGQFHSDFEIEGCDNPYSEECIILGKKCYLDKLKGVDKEGKIHIDYHLRMKGVPNKSIIHSTKKYYGGDFVKLYSNLYTGKKVNFDLLCKDKLGVSHRTQFQFNKDYTIETSQKFERELQF